ncbi:MAG: Wzz/FepE/Etk N-terminal domain-containing protein [Clostridium sp.]|nr:Wzz/FepE/Etk N-terminal domain-containing protein [Clostridium sp.]
MREEIQNNEEMEIDLRVLFFELLKRWKLVVALTVLGALLAFGYSGFFLVPQYESTAELYVLTKSTSITSLADIQMGSNLTNDYIVVVKGRPVLDQVIENLKLSETYETLEKKIELNNPANSRILQITVTDEDPSQAKKIADEVAKVSSAYISEKMDQDPPNIIQYGYSDNKPVSPVIPKWAALGGLGGLVLAMVIVILSYMLNDTIMTSEDVEKKLGMNILGTVPLETDKNAKKKRKRRIRNKRKPANTVRKSA